MSGRRKIYILKGEGIECDLEAQRFFGHPEFELQVRVLSVYDLVNARTAQLSFAAQVPDAKKGDIIFFPGGFSFADHFGSGRMLAYQLARVKFIENAIANGLHLMGVCNGFQVLAQAQLFGKNVTLEHNFKDRALGFQNRWVNCESNVDGLVTPSLRLCVRHGEGKLTVQGAGLEPHVKTFLSYNDDHFDNGSFKNIAGLVAKISNSRIWGMMPHPEVSVRMMDDPDYAGPDFNDSLRARSLAPKGAGVQLMRAILKSLEETQHA